MPRPVFAFGVSKEELVAHLDARLAHSGPYSSRGSSAPGKLAAWREARRLRRARAYLLRSQPLFLRDVLSGTLVYFALSYLLAPLLGLAEPLWRQPSISALLNATLESLGFGTILALWSDDDPYETCRLLAADLRAAELERELVGPGARAS